MWANIILAGETLRGVVSNGRVSWRYKRREYCCVHSQFERFPYWLWLKPGIWKEPLLIYVLISSFRNDSFTLINHTQSTSPLFSVCHGTPEYFPPECFTAESYDAREKSVWSIGTVAFILLFGVAPFDSTESVVANRMRAVSYTSQNLHDDSKYFIDGRVKCIQRLSWFYTNHLKKKANRWFTTTATASVVGRMMANMLMYPTTSP